MSSTIETLPEKQKKTNPFQKKIKLFILCIIILVLGWCGVKWATEWRYMVTTDDAYVQGDIVAIAPKVSGYIEDIPVKVNQRVKKGDILFRLEAGDYEIAFNQSKAKLETQKETLKLIDAQIMAARTKLDEAEAEKTAMTAITINAEGILNRAKQLNANSYVAKSEVDNAQSAYDQAVANGMKAEAQIASAKADISVLQAQKSETESQTRSLELDRDKAKRDLDFTVLRAPFDGIFGNLSAKTGDLIIMGQRLAALVPVDELYIDANYKETQLQDIYGGETVYISIDGLTKNTFEGKVLSMSPASGAVFSILPPQNATGNFTKIVQRIPVRISIPAEALATGLIRAGMSVTVSIDTRTKPVGAKPLANK